MTATSPSNGSAPHTRGFLQRPDTRLYYEVSGSGPGLVFAHGLGGNHLSWWQQVPRFAGRYTCVTFAHRGFAPSDPIQSGPDPANYADDLAALIDHVGLDDVRVVAQSMGGWSAVEYALRRPAKLKALVLAATTGSLDPAKSGIAPGALARWMSEADAGRAACAEARAHVAGGARMLREQPAQHFLYAAIDAMNAAMDKEGVRARLGAMRARDLDAAGSIVVPTLFIAGGEDIVIPCIAMPYLAKAMPNARVAEIAEAGHSAYFERPGQFNRLVADFLAAIDGA